MLSAFLLAMFVGLGRHRASSENWGIVGASQAAHGATSSVSTFFASVGASSAYLQQFFLYLSEINIVSPAIWWHE